MQMFARCCATSNSTSPELPLPPPSLPQTRSLGIGFEHLVDATFNRHVQAISMGANWDDKTNTEKTSPPPKSSFYQFTGQSAGTAHMGTGLTFHCMHDALPVSLLRHLPLLLHPFAPSDGASCQQETSTAPNKSRDLLATLLKFLPQC